MPRVVMMRLAVFIYLLGCGEQIQEGARAEVHVCNSHAGSFETVRTRLAPTVPCPRAAAPHLYVPPFCTEAGEHRWRAGGDGQYRACCQGSRGKGSGAGAAGAASSACALTPLMPNELVPVNNAGNAHWELRNAENHVGNAHVIILRMHACTLYILQEARCRDCSLASQV